MKTTLLATVCLIALGTASHAGSFNNAEFEVVATSNALTFGLSTTQNEGFTSVYLGYDALPHSVGLGQSSVTFGAEYFIGSQQTALSVTHNTVIKQDRFVFTVAPQLTYLSDAATLSSGEIYFEPTVGVSYSVSSTLNVFGDVQYSWNASNDWTRSGGLARLGADISLASNVTLTPYVAYAFDVPSASNAAQVGVSLGLTF
jgi:hypothetical protein